MVLPRCVVAIPTVMRRLSGGVAAGPVLAACGPPAVRAAVPQAARAEASARASAVLMYVNVILMPQR